MGWWLELEAGTTQALFSHYRALGLRCKLSAWLRKASLTEEHSRGGNMHRAVQGSHMHVPGNRENELLFLDC